MDEMFCLACAQLTPCAVPARPGGKNQRRIADLPYLCLQVLFVRAVPVARDTRHSSCTWLLLLFSISEFVDWGYRASGRTLFMIQFVEVNCRTSEDDNNARKGHAGQKANRQLTNKAHERRALGPSAVSVSSAMHASWRLAD